MSRLAMIPAAIFIAACATPAEEPAGELAGAADWQEGVWEYVAPLQGQSIAHGGSFVFLFGPNDGSARMTGESGTYEISGDTVKNTVRFSSDSARIGREYWWTLESMSADTISYVIMNPAGEVTGRGRSIRIR